MPFLVSLPYRHGKVYRPDLCLPEVTASPEEVPRAGGCVTSGGEKLSCWRIQMHWFITSKVFKSWKLLFGHLCLIFLYWYVWWYLLYSIHTYIYCHESLHNLNQIDLNLSGGLITALKLHQKAVGNIYKVICQKLSR